MNNSDALLQLWWFWPLLIWTVVWKGFSLWKAARNESVGWFIALMILNTVGILDIIYIYGFSKPKEKKSAK